MRVMSHCFHLAPWGEAGHPVTTQGQVLGGLLEFCMETRVPRRRRSCHLVTPMHRQSSQQTVACVS